MRYDAPLYIPLESFAMNSWNQIKISLTAQANGDSNADFWSTLTFSNEDPVQLIDAVSGNFLTTGAVSGGFSWDSGAGTIPAVPEPSIALLLGLGLVGLAAARRRRARISWISD
jgi:hypothetical protein